MHTPPFYAVKEAARADALRRFGLGTGRAVKRVFEPLPLTDQGPGLLQNLQQAWKNRGSQTLGAGASQIGQGLWRTTKGMGRGVGEIARELTFGSPFEAWKEFKNHRQQTGSIPRAMARQMGHFYVQPNSNLLNLGLTLGMPATELYQAVNGPEEHRKERMGGLIAGLAASPFTARLGIPGSFLQQPIQQLGHRIGRHFDTPTYTSNQDSEPSGQLPNLTRTNRPILEAK